MSRFTMILRLCMLFLVTALTFGLSGIVGVHIVTTFNTHTSGSLFFLLGIGFFVVLFLLSLHYILVLAIIASVLQLRLVRVVRHQDNRALPECEQQPDMANVLRDSDVLLLQRTSTLKRTLRQIGTTAVGILVLFVITEICFILVSASLSAWIGAQIGLSSTPAPTLTAPDWLILVYPCLLFGVSFIGIAGNTLRERHWQLRADDNGITLQIGRQRQSLAWNMIQAIVQSKAKFVQDMPAANYQLIGKDGRILPFTIDKPSLSGEAASGLTYDGGYERYSADAARLLATIRARSLVTLRYNAFAVGAMRRLRQRMPLTAIDKDTILTSPVADASWQPAVIPAPATIDNIKIAPRLSRWKIFWRGLTWELFIVIALGILLNISGAASQIAKSFAELQFQSITIPPMPAGILALLIFMILLVVVAFIVLIGIVLALGFVVAQTNQRKRLPQLLITPDGIANTQKQNNSLPSVIAWKDIQAWLVMPASAMQRYDTYVIVHNENQKLYWRANHDLELGGRHVTGDRKLAFQEKLTEAHRIIAARTGLPLRLVNFEE